MSRYKIICPKIGTGTNEDPIQPDITVDIKVKEVLDLLNQLRAKGIEYTDRSFFTYQVVKDLGDSYEVEIIWYDDPDRIINELKELLKVVEI